MPKKKQGLLGNRHARIYPWEKWFRAGKVTLKKEKDFRCATHGMATQVRNAASRMGLRVSVQIDDSTIHVQVRGK